MEQELLYARDLDDLVRQTVSFCPGPDHDPPVVVTVRLWTGDIVKGSFYELGPGECPDVDRREQPEEFGRFMKKLILGEKIKDQFGEKKNSFVTQDFIVSHLRPVVLRLKWQIARSRKK